MTGHIFSGLANTSKRDTFGWRRAKAYTNSTIFDTRLYASDWCIRLVGSWKWWVSLTEYRLFYRTLLQKRPMSCVDLSRMHLYASDRCIHDRSTQDWWREQVCQNWENHRSLLQKSPIKETIFCRRDFLGVQKSDWFKGVIRWGQYTRKHSLHQSCVDLSDGYDK